MEKYLCWYLYGEPYIPHDTMIEMMNESTSNSSNEHEVLNDNNNLYRNMAIDEMKMN